MQSEKPSISELVKQILGNEVEEDMERDELVNLLLSNMATQPNAKKKDYPLGQRIADNIARVAGSWGFILSFCGILALWIIMNSILLTKPYDAYPFILLNLVLSCIAAIQAPIIMMSQNRQEKKDREHAANDYKVNLKTEIILKDLYNKIDVLIENQKYIAVILDKIEKNNTVLEEEEKNFQDE